MRQDTNSLLIIILAIILPPLAMLIAKGVCTEFWLSLILTLLGFLPGLIYTLYILLKARQPVV